MESTVAGWLDLSREALDDLYKSAQPGILPNGDTNGIAIAWAVPFTRKFAQFTKFFWQGKVFDINADGETGILRNKLLPFGIKLIVAKVYRDKSWLDGKDAIIIDYSSTSLLANKIRDEIREVTPGYYLGKAWWGDKRIMDFALESTASSSPFFFSTNE
ncbi:MAG: hypothetical protein P8176_04020 [Gammaproteobacteria bacterium]